MNGGDKFYFEIPIHVVKQPRFFLAYLNISLNIRQLLEECI